MNSMYFVYIIKSITNNKTYTGFTTDLERRIEQHNKGLSEYTKSRGPWELIWYGVFQDRRMAEDFEKYLKSGSGYAFARKRLIKNEPILRSSEGAK